MTKWTWSKAIKYIEKTHGRLTISIPNKIHWNNIVIKLNCCYNYKNCQLELLLNWKFSYSHIFQVDHLFQGVHEDQPFQVVLQFLVHLQRSFNRLEYSGQFSLAKFSLERDIDTSFWLHSGLEKSANNKNSNKN